MKICYWPDGTWCEWSELSEMTHKSDDFATLEVFCSGDLDIVEEIDAFIQKLVSL